MKHKLRDGEHALYDALCRAGIYHRRAVQLQNAFTYCGYRTFSINEGRDCLQAMPSVENEEKGSTFSINEGKAELVRAMPSAENEGENSTFGPDCADAVDMSILTRDFPVHEILAAVKRASETGTTLCVMNPYEGSARSEMCRRIVREHPSTTVDNRGYLLVFNNYLPKQHFKL